MGLHYKYKIKEWTNHKGKYSHNGH
jgi:hypothetical protein